MIINYPSDWQCPNCDCKGEYLLFSFTAQVSLDRLSLGDNPSDFAALMLCPNLHVFGLDKNGITIKVKKEE